MDAELDLHYEKDHVPLNMLDVHEENYQASLSPVRIVRGHQWSGDANTTMVHLRMEELPVEIMIKYHLDHLDIVELRNDWLTNRYFRGHPNRSEERTLAYKDPRSRIMDLEHLFRPVTSRREDFYWTLNQTEIWVRKSSPPGCLDLVFKTITPNFDHFEIHVDGTETRQSSDDSFEWPLHDGDNSISVRSVNRFGVRGMVSTIQLARAGG
jgi:hypothetical protein